MGRAVVRVRRQRESRHLESGTEEPVMKKLGTLVMAGMAAALGCAEMEDGDMDPGANPFLDDDGSGKEDTGYVNVRGVEVEVSLEADIEATDYRIFDAPADLAQYAVTYLRENRTLYIEILAEDATSPERVEWQVDGVWLNNEQARAADRTKLRRFRMHRVNAVVVDGNPGGVREGQVFQAKVPVKPYSVMADAGNSCATPDNHLTLDQSIYWYLWDPDRSGCRAAVQTMAVTVERVMPMNPESYPEYDQLWADGRLDVVVVWAKLDDGDVASDYNWRNVTQLSKWLTDAGFAEQTGAPLGKRYTRSKDSRQIVVDIYGPDLFHSVADYTRLANWQKAVREHEVVMYNGHSVLGTGMAFERAEYPDFYQIFQVGSCLSYEYYVRPILAGKGGWGKVDVISNVDPTYYSENLPLTSTVLSKLFSGFEGTGQASWQDIMEAVSRRVGHSRFGVSGARGNCFSPDGDRCAPEPPPDPTNKVYENATSQAIPDNAPAGIRSTIEIPDHTTIATLDVALDITHPYVGDLEVKLEHNGLVQTLWARTGSGDDDIRSSFAVHAFDGQDAAGTWTLTVADQAARDVGRLNRWAIELTAGGDTPPPPPTDPLRFENASAVAIPDNNETGVSSTISVTTDATIGSLQVEVDITHTYAGDLVVTLVNGSTEKVLSNREGGGADDIRRTFEVTDFNGRSARGTWTLRVADRAGTDTGTLNRWALTVTPAR
jgi:subtilisin-like proprotein convertase family protein